MECQRGNTEEQNSEARWLPAVACDPHLAITSWRRGTAAGGGPYIWRGRGRQLQEVATPIPPCRQTQPDHLQA